MWLSSVSGRSRQPHEVPLLLIGLQKFRHVGADGRICAALPGGTIRLGTSPKRPMLSQRAKVARSSLDDSQMPTDLSSCIEESALSLEDLRVCDAPQCL